MTRPFRGASALLVSAIAMGTIASTAVAGPPSDRQVLATAPPGASLTVGDIDAARDTVDVVWHEQRDAGPRSFLRFGDDDLGEFEPVGVDAQGVIDLGDLGAHLVQLVGGVGPDVAEVIIVEGVIDDLLRLATPCVFGGVHAGAERGIEERGDGVAGYLPEQRRLERGQGVDLGL